jgi:hypothetical protein
LAEELPSLVGIDHGFSFPLRYFEVHQLKPPFHRHCRSWRALHSLSFGQPSQYLFVDAAPPPHLI